MGVWLTLGLLVLSARHVEQCRASNPIQDIPIERKGKRVENLSYSTRSLQANIHVVDTAGVFRRSKGLIATCMYFCSGFLIPHPAMLSYAQAFIALWYAQAAAALSFEAGSSHA